MLPETSAKRYTLASLYRIISIYKAKLRSRMRTLSETQFSILELAPVREDQTVQLTLQHSLKLAQQAERLGYSRLWLAEHHNMDGIASSATAVLLGYLLANTSTLKQKISI